MTFLCALMNTYFVDDSMIGRIFPHLLTKLHFQPSPTPPHPSKNYCQVINSVSMLHVCSVDLREIYSDDLLVVSPTDRL